MSSDELPRTSRIKAKGISEIDYMDSQPASSDERNLGKDYQPTELQTSSVVKYKEHQCGPSTSMDTSLSASKPSTSSVSSSSYLYKGYQPAELQPSSVEFKEHQCGPSTSRDTYPSASEPSTSGMKEKKLACLKVEGVQQTAESSSSHSYKKPHLTNVSTTQVKKDKFLNPTSEAKEKKSSGIPKPAPFKEFPASLSQLPFTKEKLAESLTLEEACGFLPHLMKSKRVDLSSKEIQVDQISVDLQIALRDAKNICIILEKAIKEVPKDIKAARTLAQRLKYLLSSSFGVFQKLERLGKALKENIQVYSKQTGDYHSSVDILLDYIIENILERCNQIKRTC